MDPDANLNEALDLSRKLLGFNYTLVEDINTDACRLAELVHELDHWLNRGGSLPARWKKETP